MGYQEIKLEWPEVPKLKLKVLFLSHLVLISWASLGDWSGESVLLHNIFFLFTFVWSIIHQDNEDSIFLCFAIDTLSIILDIIILASRYPSRQIVFIVCTTNYPRFLYRTSLHTNEFSAIAGIFNLFLRICSSWVLYWEWGDR